MLKLKLKSSTKIHTKLTNVSMNGAWPSVKFDNSERRTIRSFPFWKFLGPTKYKFITFQKMGVFAAPRIFCKQNQRNQVGKRKMLLWKKNTWWIETSIQLKEEANLYLSGSRSASG